MALSTVLAQAPEAASLVATCEGQARWCRLGGARLVRGKADMRFTLRRLAVVGATTLTAVLIPTAAFATCGYNPGGGGGGGVPTGYGTVLCSQSVATTGGTVSCTEGASTVKVTVASGTFKTATQVTFTAVPSGLLSLSGFFGYNVATAMGVIFTQNCVKVTGKLPHPVSVTDTNSAIGSGDKVAILYLTPPNLTLGSPSVSGHSASFSFGSDPYFALLTPTAWGRTVGFSKLLDVGRTWI
jgi:hypothetical protein